jgi:hypothetical protein
MGCVEGRLLRVAARFGYTEKTLARLEKRVTAIVEKAVKR